MMKKVIHRIVNPSISSEQRAEMIRSKVNIFEYLAPLPYDKFDCDCVPMVNDVKRKLGSMNPKDQREYLKKIGPLNCIKTKKDYKKYKIVCKNCGEKVALVYSKDSLLTDWCNLHYYYKCDRYRWYGCATLSYSPIDGLLGIECFCGNDSRDFRMKTTLPPKQIQERLKKREFGKPTSGFILKEDNG